MNRKTMDKIITTDTSPWTSTERPLHIMGPNNRTLCGKSPKRLRELGPANWDRLHESKPWGRYCECCRQRAVLQLRPKAVFWYLDPFNGGNKEFPSLRAAEKAAAKEHGSVTIHQLGPAETNEIVKFVRGLDPLP